MSTNRLIKYCSENLFSEANHVTLSVVIKRTDVHHLLDLSINPVRTQNNSKMTSATYGNLSIMKHFKMSTRLPMELNFRIFRSLLEVSLHEFLPLVIQAHSQKLLTEVLRIHRSGGLKVKINKL